MKVSSFLKETQFRCCLVSHQDITWNAEWYYRLKLGFHVALIIVELWAHFFHFYFSSVQFSRSVISNSLQPHGLQHTRLPCPSPTPRACSNSCPSCQWCHPTTSFSVVLFSSLQSFLASRSFPMRWFFISGGQSIRVSALASVLPMNIQGRFPLGWTC